MTRRRLKLLANQFDGPILDDYPSFPLTLTGSFRGERCEILATYGRGKLSRISIELEKLPWQATLSTGLFAQFGRSNSDRVVKQTSIRGTDFTVFIKREDGHAFALSNEQEEAISWLAANYVDSIEWVDRRLSCSWGSIAILDDPDTVRKALEALCRLKGGASNGAQVSTSKSST